MRKFFYAAIFIAATLLWVIHNNSHKTVDLAAQCLSTNSPITCIKEIIGENTADAKLDGSSLYVNYTNVSPVYGSGKTSYLMKMQYVIPELFSYFGQVDSITVTMFVYRNPLRDNQLTNNLPRDKRLSSTFTRANATSANWRGMFFDDIPTVADRFWENRDFSVSD